VSSFSGPCKEVLLYTSHCPPPNIIWKIIYRIVLAIVVCMNEMGFGGEKQNLVVIDYDNDGTIFLHLELWVMWRTILSWITVKSRYVWSIWSKGIINSHFGSFGLVKVGLTAMIWVLKTKKCNFGTEQSKLDRIYLSA